MMWIWFPTIVKGSNSPKLCKWQSLVKKGPGDYEAERICEDEQKSEQHKARPKESETS